MNMNKKSQQELSRAAEILGRMAAGEQVHLTGADMKLLPGHFDILSPSAAKKKGLALKRNAKPVATLERQIPGGGKADGVLYLGVSFKAKVSK